MYPSVQVQRKVSSRGLQEARGPQGELWQGLAGWGGEWDWVVSTGARVFVTELSCVVDTVGGMVVIPSSKEVATDGEVSSGGREVDTGSSAVTTGNTVVGTTVTGSLVVVTTGGGLYSVNFLDGKLVTTDGILVATGA